MVALALGAPVRPSRHAGSAAVVEAFVGAMGISVPLFIVAAIFAGLAGIITVCVALVAIAVVSTRS
jgi:hypothetical protein